MKQLRVLCTGPESSGTRLLTRLVDNLDVEAFHRSIPHGPDWWNAPEDIDRVIFINRDPWITQISSEEIGHPDNGFWSDEDKVFPDRIIKAWKVFAENVILLGVRWMPISFEGLVQRPQWTMDQIANWLNVDGKPIIENVIDPRSNIR